MLPVVASWGRKVGLVVVLWTGFSAGERLPLLEKDRRMTERNTCTWHRRQAPRDLTPKRLVCGIAAGSSVGGCQPVMAKGRHIPDCRQFQQQVGVRQEEVSQRRGEHLLFGSSNKHNNDVKVLTIDHMSVVPLPSANLVYHHLLSFRYVKLDASLYSLPCKVDLLES